MNARLRDSSGLKAHCAGNNPKGPVSVMLFRRFTIVCLLLTIFGMWFAALAANSERRTGKTSRLPCKIENNPACDREHISAQFRLIESTK